MTKRPSTDPGRPHADAASRLAELLADVTESPAPIPGADPPTPSAPPEAPGAPAAERDAPTVEDLDVPAEGSPAEPSDGPPPAGSPPAGSPPGGSSVGEVAGDESSDDESDPSEPPDPGSEEDVPAHARVGRITVRSVAFGAALLLLVTAIPILGWVGQDRLLNSRGGEVVEGGTDSSAPGYSAIVVATPTALVIQRDAQDAPVAATLLALGAGESGGTVLQVPLSTKVRKQRLLIDRLSGVYRDGGEGQDELFVREIEDRLGVDVPEENVINLDDEAFAELSGPVAPIALENPDPVVAPDGVTQFPSGPLNLTAEQVGPFLAASGGQESELGRLARNELFWTAWLEAIGSVEGTGADAFGTATTGIGPFLRHLASGEFVVDTLDVAPPEDPDAVDAPLEPAEGMEEQIIAAVPYPRSPRLGRRFAMRLQNGADGDGIPMTLIHDLILAGGSLHFLGNAPEFGRKRTLVEYGGSGWDEAVAAVNFVLDGDVVKRKMSRARADAVGTDLVITIGEDTIEAFREREKRDGG